MNITVNVLSKRSIDQAISKINAYIKTLKRLEEELPKALAGFGVMRAEARFSVATYDYLTELSGTGFNFATDIEVYAEPRENGWAVVAHGHEVCFVEFGAGVHFASEHPYLGERPPFIDNIGEYGLGHGKQDKWRIRKGVWTYGTPASNALYYTDQEIRSVLVEAATKIIRGE